MWHSTKYSWKIRTLLQFLAFILALSLIVIVSSQDTGKIRRARRPRLRLKKRIQDGEAEAVLAAANDANKNDNEGISPTRGISRQLRLRTRNRVRARRPTIVTPEPPALFDDEEVRFAILKTYFELLLISDIFKLPSFFL